MNRSRISILCFSSLMVMLCCLSARADDKIDNPKYLAWSKFKPGSNSTLSTDIERQGNTIHVERTVSLVSVTPDQVEVETNGKATVMGHDHAMPVNKETFPAKADKTEWTQTGEQDVRAMGKTFKCKIWTGTIGDPGAKDPHATPEVKATIYVSEEVPGGAVKFEAIGRDGKTMTYVLTAMEAK